MNRRIAALALLLVVAWSQPGTAVTYAKFEALTVSTTAVGFTVANIRPPGRSDAIVQLASCRLETAQIRFTVDGTTPTSTVGTLLEVGDIVEVRSADLVLAWRGIRTTATDGKLNCTYTAP
jgi:hypothetical protein